MENKFEPKTREELEQEFKKLIKNLPFLMYYCLETKQRVRVEPTELKELFYNILKRIN